jgi:type II secretory pathway component PulC
MLNSFRKVLIGASLNALALGAVAWVAWDVWQRGVLDGVRPLAVTMQDEQISERGAGVDINAIVRTHVFGRVEEAAPKAVERVAPPTRLNLKLAGVIATGSDRNGLALIEVGRGRQEVVRVGQAIGTTDATLAEVFPDYVLIGRNGQLERLDIERPKLISGAPAARASDPAETGNLPVAFDESQLERAVPARRNAISSASVEGSGPVTEERPADPGAQDPEAPQDPAQPKLKPPF